MANEEKGGEETRSNFIRDIIDEDLASGKHDFIVTRFPPEPNGYLHIGHAKSIVLNYGIARDYEGRFHLRFDDTNPLSEETEYVESIKEDVAWLGADWGDHLYFASDYFERMYELAVRLIKKGKAYVDSLDEEQISEYRGALGEPGKPSPYRDRSVEENLDLFERMRDGEFEEGEHVLRAKIDMSHPNMLMRDPLLYRIRHATHHRTGDKWCIYPMYDFAHCLEDAFEGVTHSLCTLEFENNRELYDWVIEETEVECQPRQIEFARLNLSYTIMSKRRLRRLVEEGHVSGWDDPRMPTIAGLRRRGVPPGAIHQFCNMIGVARANSLVDYQMLEYAMRDYLNTRAPRIMGVIDPIKVVVTNYPEDETEWLEAPYYPHDVPKEGTREVPFSRELYIDRSDFKENPPEDFWRLAPGVEVRLRYGYFITCEEVVKDEDGAIVELRCTYDPETKGGDSPDGRSPKGTIHWVSAEHSLEAEVRQYDRLFNTEMPDADPERDYVDFLNPDSLVATKRARVEPSVADDPSDTRYQFEREGYYWQDPVDSQSDDLVFNRIVSLRDTWAKMQARRKQEQEKKAREKAEKEREARRKKKEEKGNEDRRPSKRPASYERDKRREEHPELAERLERYQSELGLQYDDADLLSGDFPIARFYEAAIEAYERPKSVASWIVNEMLPELDERGVESVDQIDTPAEEVAALIEAFDEERITNQISRKVFGLMLETGDDPETIINEEGLERITDTNQLDPLIDQILADHPDEVERYAGGKRALLGFFIGQVMQATQGTADPELARELLQEKLPDPDDE
ncbi:MAG: glutamine--tRNA ligase/YqeY domain fusion protein [Persicimonas sp.]